ncbi:MAG: hypothetical protein QT10_C0006G0032 [archaeon GW2011_AR19]|nr:MAG: hypothetical protein QT10_C0006G0032 [archaeon GW2011_AR19]
MKSKQMSKNEFYLSKLYKKSKFCKCKNLVRLHSLAEERKELETLCNDLFDSLSGIHKGDDEVRDIYEQKIYERISFFNEHNLELNLLIKNKKLKLYYHNEKNNYNKQPTTYKRVEKLLNKKKIVCVHCSNCNQLIAPIFKK